MAAWKSIWRGRRTGYRRRKPLPAVAAFVVLCVAAGVVWVTVFDSNNAMADRTHCNAPAPTQPSASASPNGTKNDRLAKPPAPFGTQLGRQALDTTAPAPPGQVQVRVLNAGGQRGQAGLVTLALEKLGFQQAAPPANDAFYPNQNLRCDGQIRFGPDGAAAARTLSLVDPCAQLVRDERQGATVTFSLGTMFHDVQPNQAAQKALRALSAGGGSKQNASGDGGGQSGVDQQLLKDARDVTCN